MKRANPYEPDLTYKRHAECSSNFEVYEKPYNDIFIDKMYKINMSHISQQNRAITQYCVTDKLTPSKVRVVSFPEDTTTFIYLQTGSSINEIIGHMNMHQQTINSEKYADYNYELLITLTILSLTKNNGHNFIESENNKYYKYFNSNYYIMLNEEDYYKFEKLIVNQFKYYIDTNTCAPTYGTIDERSIFIIDDYVYIDKLVCNNARNNIIETLKKNKLDIVNTIMALTM
jgi:hypothetical protein